MPLEKDPNEIGALWMKTSSGGKEYLSGTINGERVVAFRQKKNSEKSPDYRVLKSVPREDAAPRRERSEADDSIEF